MSQTLRANSTTAHCMPRQMPRNGVPDSRAWRTAATLPSIARGPKPPGMRMPSTPRNCSAASSGSSVSASTQSISRCGAVVDGPVLERLDDGEVGVLQLHVLAHDRDAHGALEIVDAPAERLPLVELARLDLEAEVLEHELVQLLLAQPQWHGVEVRDVLGGDHGALVEVGEEGDLGAQLAWQRARGARHDDIRRDTDAAQLVDGVLRRLGLELARGLDHRHERDVQVEHVVAAELVAELADGLEERQALDVADRAADLDEHDVDVARGRDAEDAVLDLVRDVRDHLDGRAEVLALALAPDHGVVDAARGRVRGARGVLVDEALVVTEIEVGLGAVLGHEHLAVLVRRHRSRIDVHVRIELLHADLEAARLEQRAQRGGSDALAERGDDSARDEDVLGGPRLHSHPPRRPYDRTLGAS